MGGTKAAKQARLDAIEAVRKAGKAGSIGDVQKALAEDHGIEVSTSRLYADFSEMDWLPPSAAGKPTATRPKVTTVKRQGSSFPTVPKRAVSPAPEPHRRPGAKPAASGYKRTSVDFPEALYKRLKIAGIEEGRTLRAIIEQAATEWLERNGR